MPAWFTVGKDIKDMAKIAFGTLDGLVVTIPAVVALGSLALSCFAKTKENKDLFTGIAGACATGLDRLNGRYSDVYHHYPDDESY